MSRQDQSGCAPAIAIFAMLPLIATLHGFTISTLWGWFVVPLGVSAISLWHGCGIAALFSLFNRLPESSGDGKGSPWEGPIKVAATALATNGIALLFGLIYHSLMP